MFKFSKAFPKISSSLLLFLCSVQFQFQIAESGTGLLCPLTWIPSGFGHTVRNSVKPGIQNIVSRIAVTDPTTPTFYGGYLDLQDGIAYSVDASEGVLTSGTYSVLTNPLNCSLEWIRVEAELGPVPPKNAVAVDPGAGQLSYVGRAPFEGTYKSGATLPGSGFLFAATSKDKKVLQFSNYEILTSEQPSLRVTLSKFDFSGMDLGEIESNSKLELFSVSHAKGEDRDRLDFTLESSGLIDEYFNLVEGIADSWAGVSTIDLNMVLWCGSPAVKERLRNVLNDAGQSVGVRSDRERYLNVSAKFELARNEEGAGCSYAVILEDYEVPFSAKAEFISDNGQNKINQDQIRQILIDTGRDVTTFINLKDGSVQATITGKLDGRFVLRTYFFAARPEASPGLGPCDRHLVP